MKISELLNEDISPVEYYVSSPENINQEVMSHLVDLIAAGSEVGGDKVVRNLQNAANIAYATADGKTVGVIVLKNPLNSYRTKVFTAAGVPELAAKYDQELGYTYVDPAYRDRGVGIFLCRKMSQTITAPIFATTRETNTIINKILQIGRFQKTGHSYQSERGAGNLLLWTKG